MARADRDTESSKALRTRGLPWWREVQHKHKSKWDGKQNYATGFFSFGPELVENMESAMSKPLTASVIAEILQPYKRELLYAETYLEGAQIPKVASFRVDEPTASRKNLEKENKNPSDELLEDERLLANAEEIMV